VCDSPVLFLHGFLGHAQDAADLENALRKTRPNLRFLAPTLPGHGRANVIGNAGNDGVIKRTDRALFAGNPEAWREWIDQHITSLSRESGGAKVHLVGYSMGGRLALDYALTRSGSVRSLTLLSASFGISDEEARAARRILDDDRGESLRKGLKPFLEDWYSMALFKPLREAVGLGTLVMERSKGRGKNEVDDLATLLQSLSPGRWPSHWLDFSKRLMPLMYQVGAEDQSYVDQASRLAEMAKGQATSVSRDSDFFVPHQIQHAGHALLQEAPAECADLINKFWTSIEEKNHD
jgi:2-succinyl-6-hydroxy-2,4-cyclohexadiene-1-carboxylate synthase